jgi:hypothetical protein
METSAQYRETSAQYHEFAEECDRLAKRAKTDRERKILEEMAKAWRRVAAEANNKCQLSADCFSSASFSCSSAKRNHTRAMCSSKACVR